MALHPLAFANWLLLVTLSGVPIPASGDRDAYFRSERGCNQAIQSIQERYANSKWVAYLSSLGLDDYEFSCVVAERNARKRRT
jgi:hypothetical protein